MSQPKKYILQFGDGGSHDATVSEASASQQICNEYSWSIIPKQTGLTQQDPVWTIEVSNDDSNWKTYKSNSSNIPIGDGYEDTHLAFQYIRVNYDAKTETTGTVEFELNLKQG